MTVLPEASKVIFSLGLSAPVQLSITHEETRAHLYRTLEGSFSVSVTLWWYLLSEIVFLGMTQSSV